MENISTKTIREIALAAPATVRVFEEFEIDYCCGGRRSISDACVNAGVDPRILEDRLNMAIAGETPSAEDPERKGPAALIDYILAKHHIFTANELERLVPLMNKVASRHGENHPELYRLQTEFTEMADNLTLHMRKEEAVLFPYIQSLDNNMGELVPAPHFGTVQNPIRMMESEHDTEGERLRLMREITNDYDLPEGACPSFTALYAGLQDLERDLHRHIHLENNVLFPAAVELEQSAASSRDLR